MKKIRKLKLERETIRPLVKADLKEVAGAGSIYLPCVTLYLCTSGGHHCTQ
jgi:hypothetical protein